MLNQDLIPPTLAFLNEVYSLDPEFLSRLLQVRIPCNEAICNHPSIQVDPSTSTCNFLGLINGLLGTHEAPGRPYHLYGPICSVSTISDDKAGLLGFELTEDQLFAESP